MNLRHLVLKMEVGPEVQIRYAPTRMKYIQVYFKYTKFPFVEY